MPISIAIIDHYKMFTEGFVLLVEKDKDFKVCIESDCFKDFQFQLSHYQNSPDIFFVAIQMPDNDSLKIVGWIHQHYPASKIIAISFIEKAAKLEAMFNCGCTGFFGKEIGHEKLYKGIHDVYDNCFHEKSVDLIDSDTFFGNSHYNGIAKICFTATQVIYLKLLCTNMTYEEIAVLRKITVNTVGYYRKNIYRKMGVNSKAEMIQEAREMGYID